MQRESGDKLCAIAVIGRASHSPFLRRVLFPQPQQQTPWTTIAGQGDQPCRQTLGGNCLKAGGVHPCPSWRAHSVQQDRASKCMGQGVHPCLKLARAVHFHGRFRHNGWGVHPCQNNVEHCVAHVAMQSRSPLQGQCPQAAVAAAAADAPPWAAAAPSGRGGSTGQRL